MARMLYTIYFVDGCVLLVTSVWVLSRKRSMCLAISGVVLAGICYDTLVIATGGLIGPGPLLRSLSWLRFFIHVVQTPLLLVAVVDLARRAGLPWARHKRAWPGVWVVVTGLIGLGIATDLVGLHLEPRVFQGTLRYTEAMTAPPVATIVVIALLVILSGLLWRRTGWPWLFVATLLTMLSGGVPVAMVGPALTSGAELMLLGTFLIAERQISHATATEARANALKTL